VATGPLTNIALAFQKDREVMSRLRELVMMGGAVHVPGNMDSRSEFNFYVDPDAADYVFQETTVPKVLVPLDVTNKVLLTPTDVAGLSDTLSGRLIKSIVPKYHSGYIGNGLREARCTILWRWDSAWRKTSLICGRCSCV